MYKNFFQNIEWWANQQAKGFLSYSLSLRCHHIANAITIINAINIVNATTVINSITIVNSITAMFPLKLYAICLDAQSCLPLWDSMDCSLPGSSVHGISQARTGVGCHALIQGIFSTQRSNLGLPHCRQILYHLSHQGSLYQAINRCTVTCLKMHSLTLSTFFF